MKYFGTDGIRGQANRHPITAPLAMQLAQAAAYYFRRGSHRHRVVIGKDTRLSGYMLEPALTAGFTAMGVDVALTGPIPTPAVAMLVKSMRADLGVMISASHNPYQDNGIKLFGPDGYKLDDAAEQAIEALIDDLPADAVAASAHLGKAQRMEDARGRYVESVKASFPRHLRLDGLKIVVDCAHGAAYKVAPLVLWELGAEVIPLGVAPDGYNINARCGATAPALLANTVKLHKADIGLALDGDADRLIVADEQGTIIDGDQLLAVIATALHQRAMLQPPMVAATVMSNLGLEHYLAQQGIALQRTAVGDRYVMEAMRRDGLQLGGEQSGHMILAEHSTTGDGLAAALHILAELVQANQPASVVLRRFAPLPQQLINVRCMDAEATLAVSAVQVAVAEAAQTLAPHGRLLVRKSGTEPLVRLMAEHADATVLQQTLQRLQQVVEQHSQQAA